MLKYRKKKVWKYKVHEDYEIELFSNFGVVKHKYFEINGKKMIIRAEYAWDGATGIPDTKKSFVPALIHDVLFQCMREGLLSKTYLKSANKELEEQYIQRNGFYLWGRCLYLATTYIGRIFIKSDVLTAE